MAKSEFAEFLKSRRARLRPSDVGLPDNGRRRTPGLRREEVAALAGVSVDYLNRLEQGRDTNPSVAILGALANALQLNDSERSHLGLLALTSDPAAPCPATQVSPDTLSETVETILHSVDPVPAFALGRRLNLLGWNSAWEEFVEPTGILDDESRRNLAWFTFAHPNARRVWRDWEQTADAYSARLRYVHVRCGDDDPALTQTIEELQRFPEFARRWDAHLVDQRPTGTLRIVHPQQGSVDVEYETLDMSADQSVVVWVTEQRQARVPALRLIEGTGRASNQ